MLQLGLISLLISELTLLLIAMNFNNCYDSSFRTNLIITSFRTILYDSYFHILLRTFSIYFPYKFIVGFNQVMQNRQGGNRISNQDTFELYKAFMELAEAEEALGGGAPPVDQRVRIDKKIDEERFLDLQREHRAYGRGVPGGFGFLWGSTSRE